MGTMNAMVLAAAACLALQQPPEKNPEAADFLYLQDRTVVRGEILQYAAAGRLSVKTADAAKPLDIPLEEVARLRFSSDDARPGTPSGEQARLAGGGTVSGKIASFNGDSAVVESVAGPLRLRRQDLKALLLGSPESPLPTLRDEKKDILIREVDKKPEGGEKPGRECVADYGRLKSIGAKILFQVT